MLKAQGGPQRIWPLIMARKQRRLTQDDIARALSCSVVLIHQIETGKRLASPEQRRLIARALGMKEQDLFPEVAA